MPTLNDILTELAQLAEQHPEAVALAFSQAPEDARFVLDSARQMELARLCHADTPEGYEALYEGLHNIKPPKHIMKQVRMACKAHAEGKGFTTVGWRGSWKSVSLSVTFQLWRIGLEPKKTNLTICANDDSAEKITKAIAAAIQYHPFWKMAFPNIVPDLGRWSVDGYWVIDESLPRETWVKEQSGVIDPSFVGGGYTSTRVNGKHPTGVLVVDDIHDKNNSTSERERTSVVKAMTQVILKTVIREHDKMTTWFINVGVPWAEDDCHHTLKDSGGFLYTEIPAMRKVLEGAEGAVYLDGVNSETGVVYEDVKGWWVLTEPERFGVNSIMAERALGKADFWQMIMLDLTTASFGKLKYFPYPADQIDYSWVIFGGIDPTTFEVAKDGTPSSYFALAYAAKIPTGGAVIVDGVLEKCTLLQAENHILAAQSKFPNWQYSAVENVSVGKVFIQSLMKNSLIRIVASGLKGISDAIVHSKKDRWTGDAAKYFEEGTVFISNADTPFLNAFRRLFDKFYDLDAKDYAFDAGDGVYHALRQIPEVLMKKTGKEIKRSQMTQRTHPLAHLNSWSGYGR